MKKIGILTSGGDAPGMNACIRASVRTALTDGLEIIGIRRGFSGLIEGDFIKMDRSAVRNTVHLGGTILETSRSSEFMTVEGRRKAIDSLKKEGIEGLILIGGNGTFRGGVALSGECDIPVIGIPGTIDNDIYGTDYTIGFDSAINCAIQAIDRIRDTAQSHERLFFVEVMGHETGFIALNCSIAGGAEELLIPEDPMDIDELCSRLQTSFSRGKKSAIVVVAETDRPGWSFRIAKEVQEKIAYDSKVCILGHIQRGGSPTARDRILGSLFGARAVRALESGMNGVVVGVIHGLVCYTPMPETWEKKKPLHADLMDLNLLLSE